MNRVGKLFATTTARQIVLENRRLGDGADITTATPLFEPNEDQGLVASVREQALDLDEKRSARMKANNVLFVRGENGAYSALVIMVSCPHWVIDELEPVLTDAIDEALYN